jgi:hypothetical protein
LRLLKEKTTMITKRITQVFLGLMGLAFCKTGIEAMIDPQAVMTNVGIVLNTTSALSSMRAVYGGMHFVFGLFCIWGIVKNAEMPLTLVVLYTVGFTIGRISGIVVDGAPNEFVTTWLATEVVSLIVAATLLYFSKKSEVHYAVQA